MNEELIKALKLALKKKGLSEELYEFINVTEEGEIEAAIAKLEPLLPKPTVDVTKTLELPEFKKEIDRRITKAIQTHKAKAGGNDAPEDEEEDLDEAKVSPEMKVVLKALSTLTTEVTNLKAGKETETKQQQAQTVLKSSKIIPESVQTNWLSRIDLNSETSFEDQLTALESEFTQIAQTINNGSTYAPKPGAGGNNVKPSQEEIDAVVGNI